MVKEASFPHLDLGAYAAFRSELEKSGYRLVADVELLDVSEAPGSLIARTMIRGMLSDDGTVYTTYYQVRPRFWRRVRILLTGLRNLRFVDAPVGFARAMKTRHCVGFETEFSDGRYLLTSNAQGAAAVAAPPSFERRFFSYGTPTATLLSEHLGRLREIAGSNAQVRPLRMASYEDLRQMEQRQKVLKDSYRASQQWVTRAELRNMAHGNEELADAVYAEVQNILAAERNAG